MIVAVKRNRKQKIIKYLSILFLVGMFVAYYMYMNKQFKEEEKIRIEQKKAQKIKEQKEIASKKKFEKAIFTEIEKAVDLIGQENVRHVKVIEDKVIMICEPNTNLEALKVRYGTLALVKKTLNETIIAIDINSVIQSKLDA